MKTENVVEITKAGKQSKEQQTDRQTDKSTDSRQTDRLTESERDHVCMPSTRLTRVCSESMWGRWAGGWGEGGGCVIQNYTCTVSIL